MASLHPSDAKQTTDLFGDPPRATTSTQQTHVLWHGPTTTCAENKPESAMSPETYQHAAFPTTGPGQRACVDTARTAVAVLGALVNCAESINSDGQPSSHHPPNSAQRHQPPGIMQSTQCKHSVAAPVHLARIISAVVSASCRQQLEPDAVVPVAKGARIVEFRLRRTTPTSTHVCRSEEQDEEKISAATTACIIVTPREKKLARMAPAPPPQPSAVKLETENSDKLLNLELEMLGQMLATMPGANKALKKQQAAVRASDKLHGTRRQGPLSAATTRGTSGIPIRR